MSATQYWFADGVCDFNDGLPRKAPACLSYDADHAALVETWYRGWDHAQASFATAWRDS